MDNSKISYSKQKSEISKAKTGLFIFIFIGIVIIALSIYIYGNNNGWWENESEKEYGVNLEKPEREFCGKILMECGIDENNPRYRFHSGRFNIEDDYKWKSPEINGTNKTTILCNPDTFECSPNIHGCAPALSCNDKSCGLENTSIINNIYENAQGDYSKLNVNGRFDGKPTYNSQWNTMAEEQYIGFNCVDQEESGNINTEWFNRCLLLLNEENYDRYNDKVINKDEDKSNERYKNIKSCEKYLNIKYKDTNNSNFELKKDIILKKLNDYKKNGIDDDYQENIKQFKPRSINDILINKQQDIINSFYLNDDIELTDEEKKDLNIVLNTNSNSNSSNTRPLKVDITRNQINKLQRKTIDEDMPMENIWGKGGDTVLETFENNEDVNEEEMDNVIDENEENNINNSYEDELLNNSNQCRIEGPGCDLPKCGWKYSFVAPKEVSIHECTKKLYWTQAGPYGTIPGLVEDDPSGENNLKKIKDETLPIQSIGTDEFTGAPLEINDKGVVSNLNTGNIDSYSVMAQDSRAYNKIPAQFATCEYINNYKYNDITKKWQFQEDNGKNIDIYPGGDFNPVDGAGKPITDIKDLCNMSASLRVNKVIDPDSYFNSTKLTNGGRGFASDINGIDEQIYSTSSTVVAGCKWYEGTGEIPGQCIQEGMEGLIEQDTTKPLYENWCILDPDSKLIDLPVYEYPERENPNPNWVTSEDLENGNEERLKQQEGGIDPWINPPLKKRDFGSCIGGAGLGLATDNPPKKGPFCHPDVSGSVQNEDGTTNCPGVDDPSIQGVGKWIKPNINGTTSIEDSLQGEFEWVPLEDTKLLCTNPYKFSSYQSNSSICSTFFTSAIDTGRSNPSKGNWWRSSDNPNVGDSIPNSSTGLGSYHCPDPRFPHPVIIKDGDCDWCRAEDSNGYDCVSCCNKYDSLGWAYNAQNLNATNFGEVNGQGIIRNRAYVGSEKVSIPQRGNVDGKSFTSQGENPQKGWKVELTDEDFDDLETKGNSFTRPPYSPFLAPADNPDTSCALIQSRNNNRSYNDKDYMTETGPLCQWDLLSGSDKFDNWQNVKRDDLITTQKGIFEKASTSNLTDFSESNKDIKVREFKYPNNEFIKYYNNQ
jgi:hypothetical protein